MFTGIEVHAWHPHIYCMGMMTVDATVVDDGSLHWCDVNYYKDGYLHRGIHPPYIQDPDKSFEVYTHISRGV
jgi:hypothetical protein